MAQATATSAQELREYEAYVAAMAALADGRVIKNSSLEHAAIIIAQIFRTSQKSVDILTGNLDARVYGSDRVRSAVAEFMDNDGAKIRIMSEGEIDADNPFLLAAFDIDSERVAVRRFPSAIDTPSHFTVGDKQHLRFESDKTTCNASAMFGVGEEIKGLTSAFNEIFAATSR